MPSYAYNPEHFSALLLTTQKNVPHCFLQHRSFFRVVGNNMEKCSNFSSCVFFHVVAHNADYFPVLWTTAPNIICVVAYNVEKYISIVGNNVEKCSHLIISTNFKPYANLH
jgi:hypothetical protein